MAKKEELPIFEYLSYPDATVLAMLRTFNFFGTEEENGEICNKSKKYRGIMSDIVDLINLCGQRMENYKNCEDSNNWYVVSGYQMYEEYKKKKAALQKLIPVLKTRFADNYDKDSFLAKIKEITNDAFPPLSPYRRRSANQADRELKFQIDKIYNKRDADKKKLFTFESNFDLDKLPKPDKRKDNDPCSRLLKSLEWFADGGKIDYGNRMYNNAGELFFNSYFYHLKPKDINDFYKMLGQTYAAITDDKFENESQLYQRQENNNYFVSLPQLPEDWDLKFEEITCGLKDLLNNENFKSTFNYQQMLSILVDFAELRKGTNYSENNPQK